MLTKLFQLFTKRQRIDLSQHELDPQRPIAVHNLLCQAGYKALGEEYLKAHNALTNHSRAIFTMALLNDALDDTEPQPTLRELEERRRLAWTRIQEVQTEHKRRQFHKHHEQHT